MPASGESFRDFKPTSVVSGSVMLAHARALTFVADGILTCWRAFFLRAIGLNNVDFAVSGQGTIDKVVKPRLWQLPISRYGSFRVNPNWVKFAAVAQPLVIFCGQRKFDA